jgi:hypothetical protein
MIITKGHSIFAHSRSSTSEEFSLIIVKYKLSEYLPAGRRIGQIKPLLYYVLFDAQVKFMSKVG